MFVVVVDVALVLKDVGLLMLLSRIICVGVVPVALGSVMLVILTLVMFPLVVVLPTNQEKMLFPWVTTGNSNHTQR